MGDLKRYRDPRTGTLWSLTEADAKARGFTLAEKKRGGVKPEEGPTVKTATVEANSVELEVESEEGGRVEHRAVPGPITTARAGRPSGGRG